MIKQVKKLVDIVIPVHNRLEHTKQTLESLFKNTNPHLFNLYVINDGSTDNQIWRYLRFLEKDFEFYSHDKAVGPAACRNFITREITIAKKRSKYLYHSDNDVYFKEGWLEKLIAVFEHSQADDVKLLGGGCHPYLQNNRQIFCDIEDYAVGIKDAVSGYSQLMTWETWDKYGPFDEGQGGQEIKIMGSEDWAFCQRIIKDGGLVGAIEPEVVIHTGKTNTYGNPATGVETFKNVEGVNIL